MAQKQITIMSTCRWWAKVTRRKGSSRLYVKLFYHERTIEKTTGLEDNEENRQLVEEAVNAINRNLIHDAFRFADAFPLASEKDKKFFSKMEGYTYRISSSEVLFKEVCKVYSEERLPTIHSSSQRSDYQKAINPHILPFFGDMHVDRITNERVRQFFSSRFRGNDPEKGLLSAKRMKNIRVALADIWQFMIRHYCWKLPDPLFGVTEYINEITKKKSYELNVSSVSDQNLLEEIRRHELEEDEKTMREVIFFRDFRKILQRLDEFYRPAAEMMLLTGLSPSEMAGLHIESRRDGMLHIRWSLTDKSIRNHQKALSRTRRIPLTKAINRVLDSARDQNPKGAIFFFLTKTGRTFNDKALRKAWYNACDAAGLERCCPYILRHCFVAYCEQMQINQPRIVGLMGHADKSMIETVYGKYTHGLEKDLAAIKDYYGEDFWRE